MSIITYGGGEILQKIFQAISMLFNGGSDGIVRPLMLICASIGGFYTISRVLFTSSCEFIFLHYLFPLLVIVSLFLIPTTTVHIEDVLVKNSKDGRVLTSLYTVDHVPLLLGKFAELVSSIGYGLSQKIEKVMHMPNDPLYNSTGMIFGSEASLDISRYKISNADLEQNLRLFSKQCVLYDIALGRYSLDDLKKETDLWKFFSSKTSNVRMMRYCSSEDSKGSNCSYVSCKIAVAKMQPFFEKEKALYAKLEIGKNLPLTFQTLTGLQEESKKLIGQFLTMNVLSDELSAGNFAKSRAYNQQKSTYMTMGALASSGLVTMRIVFESFIYASVIFILPLSLIPGGAQYLSNWAWLTIWIQMWPPLYTILNYVMLLAARVKFDGWFTGATADQQGLSFFTSIGMQNLHDDIFALAGFIAVSVPYISYVILKGGLSSFVQLASSLTSPSQNAASAAASEQATGNYSFANTSMGQTSLENINAFQANTSPSVSSGYYVDNQGEMSVTYGGHTPILRQQTSELRTGVVSDEAIGQSFQTQKQQALSQHDTVQDSYLNSVSSCSRIGSDYVKHLANSDSYSEGISNQERYAAQTGANYMQSVAEGFGKQYGFSTKQSLDLLVNGSLGGSYYGFGIGGTGSKGDGALTSEAINAAKDIAKREDFQESLQIVNDYARSNTYNSSQDEGSRLGKSYSDSLDYLSSQQQSYQSAKSHLDQISDNESWYEQNSQMIKRSLNQDFIEWGSQKFADDGGANYMIRVIARDNQEEMSPLIQEFAQEMRQGWSSTKPIENFVDDIQSHHERIAGAFHRQHEEISKNHSDQTLKSDFFGKNEALSHRFQESKANTNQKMGIVDQHYQDERSDALDKFHQTQDDGILASAYRGPSKDYNLSGSFKVNQASFWMNSYPIQKDKERIAPSQTKPM